MIGADFIDALVIDSFENLMSRLDYSKRPMVL